MLNELASLARIKGDLAEQLLLAPAELALRVVQQSDLKLSKRAVEGPGGLFVRL